MIRRALLALAVLAVVAGGVAFTGQVASACSYQQTHSS